jgi:hypothetical protein
LADTGRGLSLHGAITADVCPELLLPGGVERRTMFQPVLPEETRSRVEGTFVQRGGFRTVRFFAGVQLLADNSDA